MRLNLSHEQTIRGGKAPIESNVHKTSINNTIFRIVTKGLYIRPIEAIVREICTNALDSHIAANKADVPFDVTLPSLMTPYFIVRDYGISMNNETVFNVYAVLGESTKNDTSNSIGGWGVGGKSPAAYTDTFFITTYKDGIRRIYQSSCLQNSNPLELLLEGFTDEKDGVEVKIPVKANDFARFVDAAESQLAPFDVKPNLISDIFVSNEFKYDFDLATAECLKITPTIYLPDNTGDLVKTSTEVNVYKKCTRDKLAIRMGCVVYPINITSEFFEKYDEKLEAIQKVSGANNFLIDLPVDSVDIKPSREDLDYTERTNEVLTTLINCLHKHYLKVAISIAYKARVLPTSEAIEYIFQESENDTMIQYILCKYTTRPDFSKERMLYKDVPNRFSVFAYQHLTAFNKNRDKQFHFSVCDGKKTKKFVDSPVRFWYTKNRSITLIKRSKGYIKKLDYWYDQNELPESGLVHKHYVTSSTYYSASNPPYYKQNFLAEGIGNEYIIISDEELIEALPLLKKIYQNVKVIELEDVPKEVKERNKTITATSAERDLTIVNYNSKGERDTLNQRGRYSILVIKEICETIIENNTDEVVFTTNSTYFNPQNLEELCKYHRLNVVVFDLPEGVAAKVQASKNLKFHTFDYVLKTLESNLDSRFMSQLKSNYIDRLKYRYFIEEFRYSSKIRTALKIESIRNHFFKFAPKFVKDLEYLTIAAKLVDNREREYLEKEAELLHERALKRYKTLCNYRPTLLLLDNNSKTNLIIELFKLNFKGFNPDANE